LPAVLHVSDVHFGPKHLPELSRAVLEVARRERPHLVVVSGDLTQRAKPRQFRAARAWVNSFPMPLVWVPGNHDVPMYRVWERALAPFGAWRRHFDASLVRDHSSPELTAVGVNTAFNWTTKHGRLRPRDLADLARRLAAIPQATHRIVVAHHPLATLPELGREPAARRGQDALALCRQHRVEAVLSGHLHHGFARRSAAGGPVVVHVGTTTSSRGRGGERGRNSLNWIVIDERGVEVERRFWDSRSASFRAEAAERFDLEPRA